MAQSENPNGKMIISCSCSENVLFPPPFSRNASDFQWSLYVLGKFFWRCRKAELVRVPSWSGMSQDGDVF